MRWRIVLILLALAAVGDVNVARAQSDADIFAKIVDFRPIADAIVIDGVPSDWAGLPTRTDAVEFPGDPSRDVVEIAIAPQPEALHLLAQFAAAALSTDGEYAIVFDFAFNSLPEVVITLNPSTGIHDLTVLSDVGGVIVSTTISGLPLAFGANSLEVSIPYATLSPLLPSSLADALIAANHRSFVRAYVLTFTSPGVQLDLAAPIASYRFVDTPYTLDPPLPSGLTNGSGPPFEMALPFDGQWVVLQGPAGPFSHSSIWGWDWMRVDAEFQTSSPPQSLVNDDYYAFAEPLLAPIAGTITVAIGANPDNVPGTPSSTANNNEVRIDLGSPYSLRMVHHRQGSVLVGVSDSVVVGTQLADIGNSGNSTQPHLHLDVRGNGTNRVAHTNVLVSLNSGPDDPWVRRISSWEPRTGFLAENAPTAVSAMGAAAQGLLALLLAAVWFRRSVLGGVRARNL